jgi:hypothetical protein
MAAAPSRAPAAFAVWSLSIVLLVISLVACGDDEEEMFEVSVLAEVVELGAPIEVQATDVRPDERGLLIHGVRVQWRGGEPARLDDARFTHHIESSDGDLVTSGRGCGADWDPETRRVVHICTADLQLIDLLPGETHEYPVRIHPEVGPLRLERGNYIVEEVIAWSPLPEPTPRGRFTVRLTYEVR